MPRLREVCRYVRFKNAGPFWITVDLFFDKVLVNAQDPEIRRNRLALLHNMLIEFSTIADFSEIVTNF